MEWVEVKGPTIEVAVEAALEELGLQSADEAEVEVIQEPERGFLGVGRREAVVRVKTKPRQKPKRRRRGRGGRGRGGDAASTSQPDREPAAGAEGKRSSKGKAGGGPPRQQRRDDRQKAPVEEEKSPVTPEERERVVAEFLTGVLGAFDLDGSVEVRSEDDVLYADVVGAQTEALVGQKGAVMQALHELTRTVVQRQTQEGVRLRLDVAGYAARRREALAIYAQRLVEQLRGEGGGEVMLEPMNAADRKVIHDAVAELDGAASFSEGEEPRRSVVITVPTTGGDEEE